MKKTEQIIKNFLRENKGNWFTVKEIINHVDLSYTTAYWHLKLMAQAGQIYSERHGNVILYTLKNTTKEKEWLCPTCGKSFSTKQGLLVHKGMIHKNE